jgi:hypothetical protein
MSNSVWTSLNEQLKGSRLPLLTLRLSFVGSSHRVSFRNVTCHTGWPVRRKWKLKQCKQTRIVCTGRVHSSSRLFEAVRLHQLLEGGSRLFVVRTFCCLLLAQLSLLLFLFLSSCSSLYHFFSVSAVYFRFHSISAPLFSLSLSAISLS